MRKSNKLIDILGCNQQAKRPARTVWLLSQHHPAEPDKQIAFRSENKALDYAMQSPWDCTIKEVPLHG